MKWFEEYKQPMYLKKKSESFRKNCTIFSHSKFAKKGPYHLFRVLIKKFFNNLKKSDDITSNIQ